MNSNPSQSIISASENAQLNAVQHAIDQFQISQGYFSSVLSAQTGLFSVIVGAVVALYFLFNRKVTKEEIKKESALQFQELKKEMEESYEERLKSLQEVFESGMTQHESQIGMLKGQVYRALAQFWDREGSYNTAFLWWMRAAQAFCSVSEDRLTRISLRNAKYSVEKLSSGLELSETIVGEYQKLIVDIGDPYKIEKEELDKALKDTLAKKMSSTT